MFKKRLAGSVIVFSLAMMVPHVSVAMGERKNSIVKDIGAGVVSLGALAGAAYGLYWANDYDVKKTAKPFIGLAAIGSVLTASYFCFGKFLWRKFVKSSENFVEKFMKKRAEQFKTELNDLGDTAKNRVSKEVAEQLNQLTVLMRYGMKRANPMNFRRSNNELWEEAKKEIEQSKLVEVVGKDGAMNWSFVDE